MRHFFIISALAVALFGTIGMLSGVEVVAQDSSSIVAPEARFKLLYAGGFFLESPAVAPDGSVYFSDITYSSRSGMQAGHIMRYDPGSGITSVFRSPSGMANGIEFDAQGDMIVAQGADFGGRKVTRTAMRTGKSYVVAGLYGGRPFNSPNDLAIDAKGRIYFTDPRFVGHEPLDQPVMGVYRVDPDGSVHLLAANVWMPNGIAVSRDQRTLYVISCGGFNTNILKPAPIERELPSAVHAYDLLDDGTLRYRKQLVTFAEGTWGDGMTVDFDGNIYVAVGGNIKERGVHIFDSNGRRFAFLPTPEDAVNLDFGRGADSNVLYVVCSRDPLGIGAGTSPSGTGLYSIRLKSKGIHRGASNGKATVGPVADEQAAIRELFERHRLGIESRNADAVGQTFDQSGPITVTFGGGTPMTDWPTVEREIKKWFEASEAITMKDTCVQIRIHPSGLAAWATYLTDETETTNGARVTEHLRATFGLEKHGQRWVVVQAHWSTAMGSR